MRTFIVFILEIVVVFFIDFRLLMIIMVSVMVFIVLVLMGVVIYLQYKIRRDATPTPVELRSMHENVLQLQQQLTSRV